MKTALELYRGTFTKNRNILLIRFNIFTNCGKMHPGLVMGSNQDIIIAIYIPVTFRRQNETAGCVYYFITFSKIRLVKYKILLKLPRYILLVSLDLVPIADLEKSMCYNNCRKRLVCIIHIHIS